MNEMWGGTAPTLYTVAMLWRRERWAVLCVIISPAASPIISIGPPPQSRLAKNRLDPKIWVERGPIIRSRCNIGLMDICTLTSVHTLSKSSCHSTSLWIFKSTFLSIACNRQHYIWGLTLFGPQNCDAIVSPTLRPILDLSKVKRSIPLLLPGEEVFPPKAFFDCSPVSGESCFGSDLEIKICSDCFWLRCKIQLQGPSHLLHWVMSLFRLLSLSLSLWRKLRNIGSPQPDGKMGS